MKRVKTSIKGFDKLVAGGFPQGANILICGQPGTAKSIFCLEFMYNGAVKHKEKGLFVSFEMKEKDIVSQAKQFGWDYDLAVEQGLIRFMIVPVHKINKDTVNDIVETCKKYKIKRLVIDSLSTLSNNAPIHGAINDLFLRDLLTKDSIFSPPISGDFIMKRFIYTFMDTLSDLNTTNLLVSEIGTNQGFISDDQVSEFIADGIVMINFETMGGEYSRSLIVRKMRHTKNDEDIHPLEITNTGLVLHKID